MLKWIKIVSIIFLTISLHNTAFAGNREVNGLIIGGGAGAIVGQAIGRNVESTVLGATVGGIIGAAIASEGSFRHHRPAVVNYQPRGPHGRYFNHAPRHHQSSRVFYSEPRHHGHKHYKKKYRQKRGYHKECRVYHPRSHKKNHRSGRHHRW